MATEEGEATEMREMDGQADACSDEKEEAPSDRIRGPWSEEVSSVTFQLTDWGERIPRRFELSQMSNITRIS